MKVHLECIPCFLKQSLEASRLATDDEKLHTEVMKQVMNHLLKVDFQNSPPMLSREVHKIIKTITHSDDPYKKVKDESNKNAEKLLPHLEKLIDKSDDPLETTIKIAIVGNLIDFGTMERFNVEDRIDEIVENKDFTTETYPYFEKKLDSSEEILYLADNTGEIFFDLLLIKELVKKVKKITYVVKANPIINDATIEDAKYAKIDKIAKIIAGDKGQDRSTPGIILEYASSEFMELFNKTDMVIAKGQGNYEALSDCDREVFFLLMVKCPLVAEDIGSTFSQPVFKVKKI